MGKRLRNAVILLASERCYRIKFTHAQEILAVRIFPNHRDGIFIRQVQFLLDDQGSKCHAALNRRVACASALEVFRVFAINQIPGG